MKKEYDPQPRTTYKLAGAALLWSATCYHQKVSRARVMPPTIVDLLNQSFNRYSSR